MGFAMIEKRMTDAKTAIGRQQHRLAEVEHATGIDASQLEGHSEFGAVVGQGQTGGCADTVSPSKARTNTLSGEFA